MPVNLSVKNVPDELAELLRRRATANNRSLQRELMNILETAVGRAATGTGAAERGRKTITIEEAAAISRKLLPNGTESSVAFIRKLRDSR